MFILKQIVPFARLTEHAKQMHKVYKSNVHILKPFAESGLRATMCGP